MGLRDLLTKLAGDNGIELDDDELDSIGLADGDDEISVDLSDILPGNAAGQVELFLETPSGAAEQVGDLIWEPIAREGQWALRPDGKGGKKRVPLKIVAGNSKDQRREIGLQDVVDAFDDEAIEHVTVPETHENKPTENHGYIKGLKIVSGKFKGTPTKFLMGAYDFTEPETKQKVLRGSVPSRSAGFLYDYQRTDSGKSYPVVLEHVALTPKPWLRGMPRFGRKLEATDDLPVATLTLSDEGLTDVEYTEALTDEVEEGDFLAQAAKLLWPQEESPEWLKGQVNAILDAKRSSQRKTGLYIEESPIYYRCKEAKSSEALICDGWGDGANHWIAPITIKDGQVELSDFTKWQSVDQAWVADTQEQSTNTSLNEQSTVEIEKSDLQLAQEARRSRSESDSTNEPPRGGGNMAGNETSVFQLSDEARAEFQKLQDELDAQKKRNETLSDQVDKLVGTANVNSTSTFIGELKEMGLTEERGFSGMLVEIEQIMLADDGGPALQADYFADDHNKTGELTLSDSLKRIFGALKTAEGATLKLGEIIPAPSEKLEDGDANPGKPSKGDEEEDLSDKSDEEILALDDPEYLKKLGITVESAANGSGGEQK